MVFVCMRSYIFIHTNFILIGGKVMLLYAGMADAMEYEVSSSGEIISVSIIDTEDMVVETIPVSILFNLSERGIIKIENLDLAGDEVIPIGMYETIGCGDIWYSDDDWLYVWNKQSSRVFRIPRFIVVAIFVRDGYYMLECRRPGLGNVHATFLMRSIPELRSNFNGNTGEYMTEKIFKRKCAIGALQSVYEEV